MSLFNCAPAASAETPTQTRAQIVFSIFNDREQILEEVDRPRRESDVTFQSLTVKSSALERLRKQPMAPQCYRVHL